MNRIYKIAIAACLSVFFINSGCNQKTPVSEKETKSIIPVEVSSIRTGDMVTFMELNATSEFLLKADVKAPVTGFIENIMGTQGDLVKKNELLFRIRTREAMALMGDTSNSLRLKGIVEVKAASNGIISSIDHSIGDFVSEGDRLCQIAIQESYVFILDVPFELSQAIKINSLCEIELPDRQKIKGFIKSRLPSMAGNSQTEQYIVRLTESKNLPENLTGKIRIVKESVKNAVSLPKSSILTDETMKSYWVMKLINDSMAVKVPVTLGIGADDNVQVSAPEFKSDDQFLISGNYGLGDTVYVKVSKPSTNGK